jgi:hypothetical protein
MRRNQAKCHFDKLHMNGRVIFKQIKKHTVARRPSIYLVHNCEYWWDQLNITLNLSVFKTDGKSSSIAHQPFIPQGGI